MFKSAARTIPYALVLLAIVASLLPPYVPVAQAALVQPAPDPLPQATAPDPLAHVQAALGGDPQSQLLDGALGDSLAPDVSSGAPHLEPLSPVPALPNVKLPTAQSVRPTLPDWRQYLPGQVSPAVEQDLPVVQADQSSVGPVAAGLTAIEPSIPANLPSHSELDKPQVEVQASKAPATTRPMAPGSPQSTNQAELSSDEPKLAPITMSGLSFAPPVSWSQAPRPTAVLTFTADVADVDLVRLLSPDGAYTLDAVVSWPAGASQSAFGTFGWAGMAVAEQSFFNLPSGELVQVVRPAVGNSRGSHLLLQAAFRSGRGNYALQLFGVELTAEADRAFRTMLDTLVPRPDQLPASSSAAPRSLKAGHSPAPAATELVSYTRTAAVQYANYWVKVEPLHNADGCYLWFGTGGLLCDNPGGYTGLDGAHFINMAVRAGGLDAPVLPDPVAKLIYALRDWLLANGGQDMPDASSLVAGDMVFVGKDDCWGWGGMVVGVDGGGPLINVHSGTCAGQTCDLAGLRYWQMTENHCGTTNKWSFVHIDAAAGPPADMEPPVIHWVRRWQDQGRAVFRAKVTDNVAVDEVILVYNNANVPMTLVSNDEYEVVVDVPLTQISTWQVVAIDTSGNPAVFPPGQPIRLRGYKSHNLGSTNLCGKGPYPCDQPTNMPSSDPVNTANGNFTYSTTDLTIAGLGDTDLVLQRNYNSLPNEPVGVLEYTPDGSGGMRELPYDVHPEPFGPGWTFPFATSLLILDNALLHGVQVRYADGHTASFSRNGDTFTPVETRIYDRLFLDGSGYVLKTKDLFEHRFDGTGRLQAIADRNGNAMTFTYAGDLLVRAESAGGRWMRFEYNLAGRITDVYAPEDTHLIYGYKEGLLETFTNANGKVTRYEYEGGRLSAIITPKGHPSLRLKYGDELGRVTEQTVGATDKATFAYDDAARTTTITDADNNQTMYVYDDKYRVVESRDALQHSEFYGYDDGDHRIYFKDRNSNEWHYTFDARGNRLTQDGPLGYHGEFQYNDKDLVTRFAEKIDDTRWRATDYTYDAHGNLETVTNAHQYSSTVEYDALGQPTDLWDFAGHHTTNTYNPQGDLVSVTNAETETTEYAYDGLGRMADMWTPLDYHYSYAYDGNGNLLDVYGPLGYHLGYRYDDNDNLKIEIDPNDGQVTYSYDTSENVLSVQNQMEVVTETYSYGLRNEVATFKDANDREWTYQYDAVLRLTDSDGPLATHTHFEYDALGNVTDVTDPENRVTHTQYDALSRPITVTLNYEEGGPANADTNVTTVYEYDRLGDLLRVVDPENNPTVYEYDLLGRLKLKRDAENQEWTYDYDPMGNVLLAANPRDLPTEFTYDQVYRLWTITDALTQTTTFVYDDDGNLTNEIDPLGVVTHYGYNELDRLDHQVRNFKPNRPADAQANVTTRYEYDRAGNLRFVTEPRGCKSEFVYDAAMRLTDSYDYEGAHTHFEYDKVNNLLSVTDDNDHTTSYGYDDLDRRTSVTNAEQHTVTFSYNKVGSLAGMVDARHNPTTFELDKLGRTVHMIDALDGDWYYAYNRVGSLLAETDANSHPTTHTYDKVYRLLTTTDAEGNVSAFRWDENGNLRWFIDGNSHATEYVYDALDRLYSATNAETETTGYRYDPLGNQTQLIEADGTVTLYEYDPLYRLNAVTENYQEGGPHDNDTNVLTRYVYDASGNLDLFINAEEATTDFDHDCMSRLVREVDPLGNTWKYEYDGVGNRTLRVDAKQSVTVYTYYPDDQLRHVAYADDTAVDYTYDENNNRLTMADSLGTTTWVYDELNRVTDVLDPFNRPLHFGYDPVGNRTSMAYPDGNTVQYTYYRNDWMKTMRDPTGGTVVYRRDGVGNITGITNPNTTVTTLTYDKADRVLTLSNVQTTGARKTNSAFAYTYNDVGHVTRVVSTYGWRNPPVVTENYSYDGLHRLAGMTDSDGVIMTYAYDRVGNRRAWATTDDLTTQTPRDGFAAGYDYNAANQLTTATIDSYAPNGDVTVQFAYDANGNRVNKLTIGRNGPEYGTDYAYDPENRLVVAQDYQLVDHGNRVDRAITTLAYDGGGRRLVQTYDPKTGGGGEKRMEYVFDGLDPVAEYSMLNGQRDDFYRGAMGRIAMMHHYPAGSLGQRYWYHYNFKGDVVGLTKQNSQSTHNYRYDPYGGVVPARGNFTDPHNHYTLTGKEFDENTGLVYFGARHYDPRPGVWATQDVYRGHRKDVRSLHRYAYVRTNPINNVDIYGFADANAFMFENTYLSQAPKDVRDDYSIDYKKLLQLLTEQKSSQLEDEATNFPATDPVDAAVSLLQMAVGKLQHELFMKELPRVVVPDNGALRNDPENERYRRKLIAWMAVPMYFGQEIWGALYLYREKMYKELSEREFAEMILLPKLERELIQAYIESTKPDECRIEAVTRSYRQQAQTAREFYRSLGVADPDKYQQQYCTTVVRTPSGTTAVCSGPLTGYDLQTLAALYEQNRNCRSLGSGLSVCEPYDEQKDYLTLPGVNLQPK